jgi:hypothetical protein
MDPAIVSVLSSDPVVFQDGLGQRRYLTDPNGKDSLQMLCLRAELTAVPSFEFALRERVKRLASFCPDFGRVHHVNRLKAIGAGVAIVSHAAPGLRLSEILSAAATRQLRLGLNDALFMVRQLVRATAMLHEHGQDIAHGSIGPERIVITPHGRVVLVEYVMGAALERLRFSQERYWKELRIPLPQSAALPSFDHRTDVLQVGIVALSLILGRPLDEHEYPSCVDALRADAGAISGRGDLAPLAPSLSSWLSRALQLAGRDSFASALEARAVLDEALTGSHGYTEVPNALESFLARHAASLDPQDKRIAVPSTPVASFAAERTLEDPEPVVEPAPVQAVHGAPTGLSVAPMVRATAVTTAPRPNIALGRPPEGHRNEAASFNETALKGHGAWWWTRQAIALIGLFAFAISMLAARRYVVAAFTSAASSGTLNVNTNPPGARVIVDGRVQGVTPIRLTLSAGKHVMELSRFGESRTVPLTIAAGSLSSDYLELAGHGAKPGQLEIRTDRPRARVIVDGVARGISPMTITNLAPGEHTVALESDLKSVKQTIAIAPGSTSWLVVPLSVPDGASESGWISASAPVDVQLFENGRRLGTRSDRILVAAGVHHIDVVNDALGYRATRTVHVVPGKVTPILVKLPQGRIAVNAIPWAEVWIDGEKVGETPLGGVPVSVGPHEILFRHPDLGERTRATTVTLTLPARLSVDMRK